MFIRSHFFGVNRDNDNKAGGILVIVGIILAVLAPIFAMLIQLAISRKREFLADASGALLTRYPKGLANTLKKINGFSQPMHRQSNAIAHLYISNPKGKTSGFAKLWMTHPPMAERVHALLGK